MCGLSGLNDGFDAHEIKVHLDGLYRVVVAAITNFSLFFAPVLPFVFVGVCQSEAASAPRRRRCPRAQSHRGSARASRVRFLIEL